MKKGLVISIALIAIGFFLEYLYFATDIVIFKFKLWMFGIAFMTAGMLGVLWFTVVPFLERRAEKIGKSKKKNVKDKLSS